MKMRIRHLLLVFLIAMVAVPAYAATYDASGRWFIEADPGQTISVAVYDIEVPDAWLWATIEQANGGDSFKMNSDPIADLDNIIYSGEGTVTGTRYNFDEPLVEQIDLGTIPGYEILKGFSLNIALSGFELTAPDNLIGEFEVSTLGNISLGSITFTGIPAVVPVPAAVWLMGTGMAALFGIRKRIRA